MNSLLKIGAVAAFAEAAIYLFGFAVMLLMLMPEVANTADVSEKLSFILSNKTLYQYWMLIIYVLFGIALAFLVTALHSLLMRHQQEQAGKYVPKSPTFSGLIAVGTVFGYVWVVLVIASGMITSVGLETVAPMFETKPEQAAALWLSIETVQNGLGGGVEVVGGLWVLLISLKAILQKQSCLLAHAIGFLVGAMGILTVFPSLSGFAAAFGLGQILWFVLIGLYLWEQSKTTVHQNLLKH